MSENDVVFISGATGQYSFRINGPYDRTSETRHGYAVYGKRGDASMCIEHYGERWQVMSSSQFVAYVAGGCALAACTSRQWKVWDDKTFSDAPGVKMVTGAEAERKVSGCCLRAHQHALLPPVGASNRFL